jgi:hypothetical protein
MAQDTNKIAADFLRRQEDDIARDLLAQEFEKLGRDGPARMIRNRTDNSLGAEAALSAIKRIASIAVSGVGRTLARMSAYHAIDTEREYQINRWGEDAQNKQSVAAFLTFMRHWLTRAEQEATKGGPALALESVRKVAALGVACMEINGAPVRRS